jgi:thiamine-phosphate pyrophosphorylase
MHAATTEAKQALKRRLRGLYAVTPDIGDTDDLVARVDAAIRGGAAAIQYRNKTADVSLRAMQAQALSKLCRGRALFFVNDHPALAARVGADGVHLGMHDGGIDVARERIGSSMVVGMSCYASEPRANAAVAIGADYVAFGSFFDSSVKPDAHRARPDVLQQARALEVPIVAIGGITAANAASLFAAGADAVAVISDVFARPTLAEVEAAARAIAALAPAGSA